MYYTHLKSAQKYICGKPHILKDKRSMVIVVSFLHAIVRKKSYYCKTNKNPIIVVRYVLNGCLHFHSIEN